MAVPALKRTPHTTIKQGQEHASHPVIFASEPQNHQQPISNSKTLLPLARWAKQSIQSISLHTNFQSAPGAAALSTGKHWTSEVRGLQK